MGQGGRRVIRLPPGHRRIFIRDLDLMASIGIYPHERAAPQRIRVNVEALVAEDPADDGADRLDRVVSYEPIAEAVRKVAGAGHVRLVETLAERIAAACFWDSRVRTVMVRVEKLDVFPDAAAAGVEIERSRPAETK